MNASRRHDIDGSPFFIYEKAAGRNRFKVMECGTGLRGTARERAVATTLETAVSVAGSLTPSTAGEILAGIAAPDGWSRARVAKLVALGTPGAEMWVVCGDGTGYAAVSEGLTISAAEALFGHNDLGCWVIRWHDPDGSECRGLYVVPLADAERAWWVLNDAGRVVAGGPPIYDESRAREIAAGLDGRPVHGIGELRRAA